MDTYQQGLKAGLAQGEAAVAASVDRMKAMLNFTAAPTITPRISAPGGGGGSSEGGGGSAKGKSASLGRGATHFNGPIHVHGVSNVASLERGIRREADRRVREARNDALHDTGNDFA